MVTHYSQMGEQEAILEWAASLPAPGSFVDLGAYDGVFYSNTAALADLGWPGICVDAAPDAIKACRERYADRSDVEVIEAAFTLDDVGAAVIHWTPGGVYSGLEASQRDDVTLEEIQVEALGLRWLDERMRSLPHPIFCSVDLEGASIDALRWLLHSDDVGCVCVEANNPRDRDDARALMHGWREVPMYGNHVNLLFTR